MFFNTVWYLCCRLNKFGGISKTNNHLRIEEHWGLSVRHKKTTSYAITTVYRVVAKFQARGEVEKSHHIPPKYRKRTKKSSRPYKVVVVVVVVRL